MNLTQAIFSKSVFFFTLIPIFAVWGFWVTYFTRPPETLGPLEHIHGLAMFGWCIMLIAQSLLIRTRRRDLHRLFGKFSYVLAPLIVISTVSLANYRLNLRGLTDEGLYSLYLQLSILVQFMVCYGLAVWNLKRPEVHARFMVCTALTMLDPIFARILLVNFFQVELTSGIAQYMTYTLVDLILVGLVVWDWKSHQRKDVFLPILIVFVVSQLPTFFVVQWPAWKTFSSWYLFLPLS